MAFEGPLYIDFKFDSRRACLPAYEALKLAISLSRWALTGVKIECLNELHTPGGVDQVHCREPAVRALPASTFAGRSKRPIARSGPSCAASREGGAGESGPRPVGGNSSRPGFWYVPNTMSKIGSTSAKFRL